MATTFAALASRFAACFEEPASGPLRERYASTFDLNPVCVPYLSVHLFGDESFKRARLMGGLADAYRQAGFDARGELPDHIANVLRFLPRMSAEEQQDLIAFVLRPSVQRMADALAATRNPYRHLLNALRAALARADRVETAHA